MSTALYCSVCSASVLLYGSAGDKVGAKSCYTCNQLGLKEICCHLLYCLHSALSACYDPSSRPSSLVGSLATEPRCDFSKGRQGSLFGVDVVIACDRRRETRPQATVAGYHAE